MKQNKDSKAGITAKKSKGKKIMLIGFGLAGAGILSYFGWQYWKKHKAESDGSEGDAPDFSAKNEYTPHPSKPKSQSKTNSAPPVRNDNFPLRKGSKGDKVKVLQNSLIAKYGQGILPNYGADGDFGSETAAALEKAGLPSSIDESTFIAFTKKPTENKLSPSDAGKLLYAAAVKKNFPKTLALLKSLKTVSDYTTASAAFQMYRLGGVRQTLVNGVLNTFQDDKQKQAIKLALAGMGLKYDGNKWSLSGLGSTRVLITSQPTKVWRNPRTAVQVPANMVLGKEIKRRGNHVVFENEHQYFIVQAAHVKQHN